MSVQANAHAVAEALEPLFPVLDDELCSIVQSRPDSKARKYYRLTQVMDKALAKIIPHTPCKDNCSHCCHMPVALTEFEAERISVFTGLKAKKLANVTRSELRAQRDAWLVAYTGKACPFLKGQSCSIYAVRPMACRQHHNLSDTNECCDLTKVPMQVTPSVDLGFIEKAYVTVFLNEVWGEIREFFP